MSDLNKNRRVGKRSLKNAHKTMNRFPTFFAFSTQILSLTNVLVLIHLDRVAAHNLFVNRHRRAAKPFQCIAGQVDFVEFEDVVVAENNYNNNISMERGKLLREFRGGNGQLTLVSLTHHWSGFHSPDETGSKASAAVKNSILPYEKSKNYYTNYKKKKGRMD